MVSNLTEKFGLAENVTLKNRNLMIFEFSRLILEINSKVVVLNVTIEKLSKI